MSKARGSQDEAKDDDRRRLGERLRDAREYLGFSQVEVANYLGVPRSALSLMETGQRKVDALELKKLAGLYRRPLGHFTGEELQEVVSKDVEHLARKLWALAPEDREELSQFAEFLRSRNQRKET